MTAETTASATAVPFPLSNMTTSPGPIPRTAADRCTDDPSAAMTTWLADVLPRFHRAAAALGRSSR